MQDQHPHPALGHMALAGIKFCHLAAQTGYCAPWLSRVLHGQYRAVPAFRHKVAEALGRPENELFRDDTSVSS